MTAGSRVRLGLAACVLALALPARSEVAVPPAPKSHATDLTGVVSAGRLAKLSARLAAYEKKTTNQVVVYVDHAVPSGATLEEFATASFNAWGVGQKGKDNGVVFFVFVDDRQMRLEVGSGVTAALPHELAAEIIDTEAKPRFRAKDFAGGLEAVVGRVTKALDAAAAGRR